MSGPVPEGHLLAAALAYAGRGWPVLPLHSIRDGRCTCRKADCGSPGKHPRTRHGLKDATIDLGRIRAWFGRWRDANVGVVTGAASGLAALDIDPRHGGEESLATLQTEHGPLPETVESLTGRGGRHLLFAHPGGPVHNKVGLLPGIDVRGDGGYIVSPPSRTIRAYTWELAHHPNDIALAPVPGWLLTIIRDHGRPVPPPRDVDRTIRKRRRNSTLASIAGGLRYRGMDESQILAELLAVNLAQCVPPLPHDEVEKIVRSIARYPVGPSLSEVAEAIQRFPWRGEAGGTDSMVLRAHLDCCRRGHAQHDASTRDIADRAGITRATVRASHRRLRQAGWLELLQRPRGGHAARWRLCPRPAIDRSPPEVRA